MQYESYPKFRQAIDEALRGQPHPQDQDISASFERAKLAMHVLRVLALDHRACGQQDPGNILASYLVGEEIWAKEIEKDEDGGEESRGIAGRETRTIGSDSGSGAPGRRQEEGETGTEAETAAQKKEREKTPSKTQMKRSLWVMLQTRTQPFVTTQ